MKKYIGILLSIFLLPAFIQPSIAQVKKTSNTEIQKKIGPEKKTMTWTTKSEEAGKLASKAVKHMMNIEFAQAYDLFNASLKLDPNFTIPLVFMSNLTQGAVKKDFVQRALKSTVGKTEGEKIFASLAEPENTAETRRNTWEKLHRMFPDGEMINTYYVFTRPNNEESFNAAEAYVNMHPESGWMHNILGYYYLNDKKDNEKAKECFEKYIKLYPEGSNPYDSMGEFYFLTGDMDNSEKYYTMALEKYPFNISSIDKLKEIKAKSGMEESKAK